uniref:Superkiller complex protein 8 n=1 Tax=Astatotilapia calliptera TaxID=8154 RepID=A0A3P8R411_ASTCA
MSTQYSILFKQEHAHDDAIWTAAWGKSEADGSETIVTGSLDDMVKVWKWSDEKLELQWTLEGHQLGVVSVDISHNGAIAASSSLDAHIRLWDLESGKQIKSMDAGPVDAWTVAFSPDSKYIATGSHLGKVNIFGVDSGKKEYSLDTRGKFILSIAYGQRLNVIQSHFATVVTYKVISLLVLASQSPDGKYLASGAIDGIINIFDIATGKLLHTLEGHAMPIRSLTFSPDSQLLVTASDDGYIKIYDVQHANLAGTLSGHGSWVLSVAFSPDDTHFVSSSSDKSVKVWDAGSRACINTFFDHQDQVWSVKYNSTGSKIISAGDDRAIHIYDCPM